MGISRKKLRIAEFDTAAVPFPIPDDFLSPRAPLLIAAEIAAGLAGKGHDVTFFGPAGSHSDKFRVSTSGFEPLYKSKIFDDPNIRGTEREKVFSLFDQHLISLIFQEHKVKPFDIIHIHPADRALPFINLFPEAKIVHTLHDPIYPWRAEMFRMFQTKNQHFISISNAQRKPAPDLNYAATVYNGIDTESFSFSEKPGDYLFFSGRLQENKGVYEAIQAAKMSGEKLFIAGSPAEGAYWEEKIKPYLDENIQYVGFVPYRELQEYYRNAKATLMPVKWEEPFGLVMTESMACGTPVLAFRRGSVPEIVVDGKTGFIVNTVDEMAEAVKKIDQIDRRACREHVEKNFCIERMVEGYEDAFLKIAE